MKQTFCLMDNEGQIRPVAKSSNPDHYEIFYENDTSYPSCLEELQGVLNGAMNVYSAFLDGQEVNICHLPEGIYQIVVTLNPSNWFLESDYTNNVGWTSFELEWDNEGNPTVCTIPDSKNGIWFDKYPYSPSPTASMWPTYERAAYSPTASTWPRTTPRPSVCVGNTPNWENAFGAGCGWYKEFDTPGCELYGYEFFEDFMGPAMKNVTTANYLSWKSAQESHRQPNQRQR